MMYRIISKLSECRQNPFNQEILELETVKEYGYKPITSLSAQRSLNGAFADIQIKCFLNFRDSGKIQGEIEYNDRQGKA